MLTRCYQFSVVDDTNLIGIHNGGQFVSNHHEGLAFYKFCNGCFHLFFIFGVSIGCSLVPISTTGANPHKYGTFQKI